MAGIVDPASRSSVSRRVGKRQRVAVGMSPAGEHHPRCRRRSEGSPSIPRRRASRRVRHGYVERCDMRRWPPSLQVQVVVRRGRPRQAPREARRSGPSSQPVAPRPSATVRPCRPTRSSSRRRSERRTPTSGVRGRSAGRHLREGAAHRAAGRSAARGEPGRIDGMCSSWRWPNRFVSASDSPSIHGNASRRVTRSSGSAAIAFASRRTTDRRRRGPREPIARRSAPGTRR